MRVDSRLAPPPQMHRMRSRSMGALSPSSPSPVDSQPRRHSIDRTLQQQAPRGISKQDFRAKNEGLTKTADKVSALKAAIADAKGGVEEIQQNSGCMSRALKAIWKGTKAFGGFLGKTLGTVLTNVVLKPVGHLVGLGLDAVGLVGTGACAVVTGLIDLAGKGIRGESFGLTKGLWEGYKDAVKGVHKGVTLAGNWSKLKIEQGLGLKEKAEEAQFQEADWSNRIDKANTVVDTLMSTRAPVGWALEETGMWESAGESLQDISTPLMIGAKGVKALVDLYGSHKTSTRLNAVQELENSENQISEPIRDTMELAKKNLKQTTRHRVWSAICNGAIAIGTAVAVGVGAVCAGALLATPVGWGIAIGAAAVTVGAGCYQAYKRQGRTDQINTMRQGLQEARQNLQQLRTQREQTPPMARGAIDQQIQKWEKVEDMAQRFLRQTSAVEATKTLMQALHSDGRQMIGALSFIDKLDVPTDFRSLSNQEQFRVIYQRLEMFNAF